MNVFHYGIHVDSEQPITGVRQANRLGSAFWDEAGDGIDLAWEEHCQSCKGLCHRCHCNHDGKNGACSCSRYSLERHQEQAEHPYDPRDGEHDGCGPEERGDVLVGSWKKGADGKWEPDQEAGEYAGIVREFTVQVVWSKTTSQAALCSPCYPGQADLDNPGQFLAFDLPKDLVEDDG